MWDMLIVWDMLVVWGMLVVWDSPEEAPKRVVLNSSFSTETAANLCRNGRVQNDTFLDTRNACERQRRAKGPREKGTTRRVIRLTHQLLRR